MPLTCPGRLPFTIVFTKIIFSNFRSLANEGDLKPYGGEGSNHRQEAKPLGNLLWNVGSYIAEYCSVDANCRQRRYARMTPIGVIGV